MEWTKLKSGGEENSGFTNWVLLVLHVHVLREEAFKIFAPGSSIGPQLREHTHPG